MRAVSGYKAYTSIVIHQPATMETNEPREMVKKKKKKKKCLSISQESKKRGTEEWEPEGLNKENKE